MGAYLSQQIAAGNIPTVHALEQRFDKRDAGDPLEHNALSGAQHPLSLYDSLLPSHNSSTELH